MVRRPGWWQRFFGTGNWENYVVGWGHCRWPHGTKPNHRVGTFFFKFCVHLQSNTIYLEHPAFVDASPLEMSFPARHLGQHLYCWNMLEQVSLSKPSPHDFSILGRSISICPHRLGVLPSRRRVSPLLRPAPLPRVEISSKDPESSRFMNFSSYNGLDGWNMSLPFLCTFFSIAIGSCSSTVSQHSFDATQHPKKSRLRSKTPPKLVRTEAFQDTQNYFKTGPSKCWEWSYTAIFLWLTGYDLLHWCPTLQFEMQVL